MLTFDNLNADFSTEIKGKILFEMACNNCHPFGRNVIIPEKIISRKALEINFLTTSDNFIYYIRNGKNSMSGFIHIITEKDFSSLLNYISLTFN